ncbi:ribosome biogenesis GTP-binding protein YihA/YsxC [Ectothiorhodospira lacustris]|uniref:ribosome biogenesis GTP-binding protein YihA/YsxC n=1 Tax=Ectothiorhodospira lacustris TaxID=2899127 RepID=UPI001EE80E9C|nr:ribosome biogenesis GTP-binding protein YihA/YsxC [Ectothiorhodospira lacustris]MCG5499259.1 ribosome biogenesis GTP-binding protein YihA/YsxC [Ectothiorhodospira lacustris]MCG5509753.1 ribosome biogenesis GTP-binding protein YihA/YsxC [Ectothiorhodospira lacustris]MCG5522333.1 ribosome biogenesis GTP-binding protein YihA/YsxC [Ectothiorhodospira lacustris]
MNPAYHQAEFLTSAASLKGLPPEQGHEVAFAGRSNSGKSSAINTLCRQRALARTSKTPGRTQLINFFALDGERRLVDLPGYGYAKVPEAMRRRWGQLMENYLAQRACLRGLVLVMDIRHPLTDHDWQMIGWVHARHLPLHVLLTKSDKLKRGPVMDTVRQVVRALGNEGVEATVQPFSSLKKQGVDDAHSVLDGWLFSEGGLAHPEQEA